MQYRRWSFFILLIWSFIQWVVVCIFVPETYHPVLLRNKARKMRRETGYQEWQAPIEKMERSIPKVQRLLSTAFGDAHLYRRQSSARSTGHLCCSFSSRCVLICVYSQQSFLVSSIFSSELLRSSFAIITNSSSGKLDCLSQASRSVCYSQLLQLTGGSRTIFVSFGSRGYRAENVGPQSLSTVYLLLLSVRRLPPSVYFGSAGQRKAGCRDER